MIHSYYIFSKFVKITNHIKKKGYIKENISSTMNLKERGITVGDLLITFLIILTTTILIKTFNKDKKTTLNNNNHEVLFQKKASLSKINLNNLSV